jgi:CHASE2 domain-containing sensor protein
MIKSLPVKKNRSLARKRAGAWYYLFHRDTLLATILVFICIFSLARLEVMLGLFDPKDMTAKDFDYNDLAFNLLSKYRNVAVDTGIYLVDIGHMDRPRIAAVITKVSLAHPKVIGVDVLFGRPAGSGQDSALNTSFGESPGTPGDNIFMAKNEKSGYVNFTPGNQHVIRCFNPYLVHGDTSLSFALAIVKAADPVKFRELVARHHAAEVINYRRSEDKFIVIDGNSAQADFTALKNKIVMIGTLDTGYNFEDKHFTPLNTAFAGKSLPDMSGLVIQANIVSMMLDNNYIDHWNSVLNWFFAFLICWLHMGFFIAYFVEKHMWFHLAAKLAQLVSSVVFIYLGLLLFYDFNEQVNMAGALAAIILAVDVLYFYEAGVTWLHHKKGFKTLFHHEYAN